MLGVALGLLPDANDIVQGFGVSWPLFLPPNQPTSTVRSQKTRIWASNEVPKCDTNIAVGHCIPSTELFHVNSRKNATPPPPELRGFLAVVD